MPARRLFGGKDLNLGVSDSSVVAPWAPLSQNGSLIFLRSHRFSLMLPHSVVPIRAVVPS